MYYSWSILLTLRDRSPLTMGEEVEGLPQDQVMSKSMTGPQLQGSVSSCHHPGIVPIPRPPSHPSSLIWVSHCHPHLRSWWKEMILACLRPSHAHLGWHSFFFIRTSRVLHGSTSDKASLDIISSEKLSFAWKKLFLWGQTPFPPFCSSAHLPLWGSGVHPSAWNFLGTRGGTRNSGAQKPSTWSSTTLMVLLGMSH